MMDDLRPRTRGLSSCPICHYPGRRSFLTWRIRAFRGIGELTMPRLGLVTLIAGRNGVGRPLSSMPSALTRRGVAVLRWRISSSAARDSRPKHTTLAGHPSRSTRPDGSGLWASVSDVGARQTD